MPHLNGRVHPDVATPDELRALLSVRLDALHAAQAKLGQEAPVPMHERWGWKGLIRTHGRTLDGNLVATVTVEVPGGGVVYTRRVRLVQQKPLPRGLR